MGYMCYLTAKNIVIDVVPETFNRIVYIKDNNEAYDKYIESKYGIISKTFEMHNDGRFYYTSTPFLKNEFVIQLTRGKVVSDRFYDILLTDSKFQHLYSEWVKKQVEIDDENVELYFNRASCGSRNIGDNVYIDFDKITALDNLEEDICKNTHNLYIRSNHYEQGVDVKINNIDNIKEVLNYADLIEKKIKPRVFIDTNHFMPSENNHLLIYLLSENTNKHLMTIMYDYDENVKKYYYVSNDSDWIKYE